MRSKDQVHWPLPLFFGTVSGTTTILLNLHDEFLDKSIGVCPARLRLVKTP
jgi:hypothetical protein